MKKMRGDNALLRAFDEAAEWVKPDGTSPASVAESRGVAGHILGSNFGLPVVAWEDGGVWSYCVLNRYRFLTTTLLARSKSGLVRLLRTLYTRVRTEADAQVWQAYYNRLWERRYRKWCCTGKRSCDCQLHRARRHGR